MAEKLITAGTFVHEIRKFDPDFVLPARVDRVVEDNADILGLIGPQEPGVTAEIARTCGFHDVQSFLETVKAAPAIIEGLLYRLGVVVLYGKAGIGKSYVTVDLAMSIACDRPEFHGRPLKAKGLRVALLLYEGEYAIPRRMLAWMKEHGTRPAPDRLLLRYNLAKLQDEQGFAALRDDLLRVRADIVIVDTFGAATAGLDEDRAKDMAPIVERLRDLARSLNGMCLLVAHPPKGNAETVRGSGVLEANTDGLIAVREEDEGISLVARKVRAGAAAKPLALRFKTIDLGPDPDFPGETIRDSVLELALDEAEVFENIVVKTAANRDSITVAELVKALVAADVCKQSKAYKLVDLYLPEGDVVAFGHNEFRRCQKIIGIIPIEQ
jgi:hypothetical protein